MNNDHERDPNKEVDLDTLKSTVRERRQRGERIVFTNGCFDVLHVGHVRYLRAARRLGDVLIVGINDDATVQQLKGAGRPIYPLDERIEILSSLSFVDFVIPFDTTSVEPLVRELRPDVLAKGGDYEATEVIGGEFVRSYGGEVIVLQLVADRSTTNTLERIRGSE